MASERPSRRPRDRSDDEGIGVFYKVPSPDLQANVRSLVLLFARFAAAHHRNLAAIARHVWQLLGLGPWIMNDARTGQISHESVNINLY
jgi:hypothetical protein